MKTESEAQSRDESGGPAGTFPETRWSLVMRMQTGEGSSAETALGELCEIYWYPLYGWLRRRGETPEDAEDLVQGLFASLLKRDDLASVAREKGKLRTFFLTALKNFSIKEYEKSAAAKRGGSVTHVRIDRDEAEMRYANEPADRPDLTPDRLFEQAWATLLLGRVFAALRTEYEARGAEAVLDVLKPHLAWNDTDRPLKDAAEQLQMREGAVRVAVLRLRKRYRRLLEKEIEQTVGSAAEVENEIAFLHRVFSV